MSRVIAFVVVAALGASSPALAQTMSGMDHGSMPGMKMPSAKPVAKPPKPAATIPKAKRVKRTLPNSSSATPPPAHEMSGMDHSSMPGMDMAADKPSTASPPLDAMTMDGKAMDQSAMPDMAKSGTDLPAGNAPAPAPPTDHYATRIFPAAQIERAHGEMMNESGAQTFGFVMFNLAEYQPRRGQDGFRWDGEGWYGGDINRFTIKTEGEGRLGEGVEEAEVQALYSRAIDPYFNAQVGIRQDLGRGARRTYATVGFEGLAPYWFEVEGALFLSDKGDVLGRLGGYYDQRLTQRLVLQPRVELNFAAQDVPSSRIGAGLSTAELGLRLRYEIKRQFAPYVGVSWARKVGQTGRYALADGEDATSAGLVAGIRFWF